METNLISADLLRQFKDLVNGAKIEKIDSDEQLSNAVELVKISRHVAKDMDGERKDKVKPLNDEVDRINGEYQPKIKAMKALADNADNKGAEYQLKKARIIEIARLEAERKAEAERRRLAEIENQRLIEEEALRKEAQVKLEAAQNATSESDKQALISQATTASEVADIALDEAARAASAAMEVVAEKSTERVITPLGFKPTYEYSAIVVSSREAMKWIVDNGEWNLVGGLAFEKMVTAAMDKLAKFKKDDFSVPGCRLNKVACGTRIKY